MKKQLPKSQTLPYKSVTPKSKPRIMANAVARADRTSIWDTETLDKVVAKLQRGDQVRVIKTISNKNNILVGVLENEKGYINLKNFIVTMY